MSQLLAEALLQRRKAPRVAKLHWVSRSMKARIDISDKEALYALLGLKGFQGGERLGNREGP